MQLTSGKFGLDQYVKSAGSLGIFDIDGDYKIKFVTTGASPSNTFEVRGRIQGQDEFVLIDTVVSNITKTIIVDEYDFLEIVCTVFAPVQNSVQIAGSGFGSTGGLDTIVTDSGTIGPVSNLTITSSNNSVQVSTIYPNSVDLKVSLPALTVVIDKFTLSSSDIISKSITLSQAPIVPSEVLLSVGGVDQEVGIDFSISGTLISWSGMGLDGILSIGDIVTVTYN